ncbi:MAG: ABC transporter substrate-binding protein, partial [Planctomycetales bacterium]|nr:ABC transporter substrate-binding protein [Planctomycetales bacterium]
MLNWHPEAEHGGFYAAQVHGIFERYGLDVEIRPGGPNAPVAQELVTGRVQFAIGNADDVLLFRNEDVPVVALMAPIQNTPRCILVRADSDVHALSELQGMVLQANVGRPFLTFMQAEGLLEGVQVVPYGGSIAKLVSDN